MSTNYVIIVEKYSERHYIKRFKKKYKNFWDVTWRGVLEEFRRFDSLLETEIAEEIVCKGDISICKTEFRVAGTKFSRKNSGNRCILAVNKKSREICVLLVYHKNDLVGSNETVEWKKVVRGCYEGYGFCR
jgi:hypothetical protein